MYYELYIDILFLVNFMMDYLLLLLVKKMLKCSATHWRIFVGALLGAFLTCVVVVLPISNTFFKLILFHVFVNTCMIQIGLKIRSIRSLIRAVLLLYIGSFLMGGIMEVFRPYIKMGSLFFAVALSGYYVSLNIWKFISHLQRWNRYHCDVELHYKGQVQRIRGVIDTGNGLYDPVSEQPVSIIERKTAEKLLQGEWGSNIRYIPYRTIGKKDGVLPVLRIDKLQVYGEQECCIDNPMIGICEEKLSAKGAYEMILNPNLF